MMRKRGRKRGKIGMMRTSKERRERTEKAVACDVDLIGRVSANEIKLPDMRNLVTLITASTKPRSTKWRRR